MENEVDIDMSEATALMNVLEKDDKNKMAEAIKNLADIDFDAFSPEMKERMLELIRQNTLPIQRFFASYKCAIMEVETKFRVLNEEFSLLYDGNPIETIKSRIKSNDSEAAKSIVLAQNTAQKMRVRSCLSSPAMAKCFVALKSKPKSIIRAKYCITESEKPI